MYRRTPLPPAKVSVSPLYQTSAPPKINLPAPHTVLPRFSTFCEGFQCPHPHPKKSVPPLSPQMSSGITACSGAFRQGR